jgi:class 3 adenylate cyclase
VKHNLFDADTIIKRTVGYIVTTGIVVGAYAAVSIMLNVFLGRYELTESQAFPVLFTLGVILVFNPLRNRIQSLVDRLFFRKEYNYQETVQKIIETMRSLLNQGQICQGIMKFALEPMFVDSGSVMILSRDKNEYECFIQTDEKQKQNSATDAAASVSLTTESSMGEDEAPQETVVVGAGRENADLILSADDPLLQKLAELKKEVTLYDIQEDPLFEDEREACERAFERLGATLMVPLIYEDHLTGVIALGQKKSGKFYRREDINLLNTLAGQGALAFENARMVDEIIEKERMRAKILDAFGKYVTPEVRDQILEGNIPLDGESKEVTVLFADLRDFTTLAESTTPKAVVRIINGYFSEMADAIGQNHGLVLQFIGDEIEAVFGAPLPLENHPTHAFRAALAMQQRLVVVNEKLAQQGYGPLRHGIGIHTGGVVAANIGSEDRLSYAMVGDTVNLASRIQDLNKEFGTDLLISATTVDRLADNIAVEKLPATTVKGKRNPVEVYKLK